MFREMRRFKQQISEDECKELLVQEKRGVLSVMGEDGYPYGIPMDFYYDEPSNRLYFHSAKEGHKIDAIKKCDKVCFTIWNKGYQNPGDWVWHITSVIVFGQAFLVDDDKLREEMVRKLGLKYYPTAESVEEEIRSAIDRVQLVAVEVEHMTGKLVTES